MAKMKKKAGEINSSSMADIAFLLLIFFLVTTTMDVDMGMRRVLPPAGNEEQKQDDIEIKERNILIVNISKSGKIMVGKNEYSRNDLERNGEHSRLSKETFDFLVDVNRSEKKSVEIEAGKSFNLSEGLVSLMADNETTYDVYLQVQDELTHAFNLYREYVSFEVYGKAIEDLDEEQQKNLRSKVPPKISEAKPFKAGN
jgi:biopolymer transport protein ExbD